MSVCVFLALLTVVAAGSMAVSASDHEIVVNPEQDVGDADTIQEGIDMAEDGDIVLVSEGEYNESVVVDKSVHVVAEDNVTLDRGDTEGTAFTIGNDTRALEDVVVEGFTIQNYAGDDDDIMTGGGVLVVDDVTNVTVANNEISNVEGIGIGALNLGGQQHEINVVDNDVHAAASGGIGISATDGGTTSDVQFLGNEITGIDANAVVVEAAGEGDVNDVTVAGTETEDVSNGALFFAENESSLTDLNVTANDFSDAADTGLQFFVSPEGTLTDVEVADTAVYGAGEAAVTMFGDGELERVGFENVAANGSETGIQGYFGESAQVRDLNFEEVTVANATDAGIRISATDSAAVDGISLSEIDASGTVNDGIRIQSDEMASVENVDVETVDLRDTGGAAAFAAGNSSTLSDVDMHEIFVSGSDRGVTFDAGWDDSHDATVTNVSITDSGLNETDEAGLNLNAFGSSTLENVNLDSVAAEDNHVGIRVFSGDDGAVSNVSIARTMMTATEMGVHISAEDSATVDGISLTEVDASEATNDGLRFDAADEATIRNVDLETVDLRDTGGAGAFSAGNSSTVTDVEISEILVAGSDRGLSFDAGWDDSHDATLSNVSITESGLNETAGTGLDLSAFGSSTLENVSLDTVAAGDNDVGIQAYARDDATVTDISIASTLATANQNAGVDIFATDSATVDDVSLMEVDVSETVNDGVRLRSEGAATVENVVLKTVDMRDTGGAATFSAGDSATLTNVDITQVLVSGSDRGVTFDAGWDDSHDATVSNVSIIESGLNETAGTGLDLSAFGSSTLENVSLDTVAAGDNEVGIQAFSGDSASVSDISIARTMADANRNGSVELIATEDSSITGVDLEEVLLEETADGPGIGLYADEGAIHDVNLDTVVIDNNDQGVELFATNSGSIEYIELDTVIIQHSDSSGINVAADETATLADIDVRESLIRDNGASGLYVGEDASASEITVHYSFLARNDAAGVYNDNADEAVDARFNYWGNGSGPSSSTGEELLDPVTDKPAYGSGDAISEGQDGVANVRFSPAIGAKADQREQMVPLSELAGDELPEEFEFEIDGVSIDEPMTFEVEGETITGTPTDFVGLSTWERSMLPLRTDRTDGATVIDLPPLIINTDEGDVPANVDSLAVYNVGDTVTVDFEQVTGAQTDKFADTPAHVIVVKADSEEMSEMIRNGELQDDLVDEIEAEIEAKADDGLDENTGQVNVSIDGIDVVEIKQVDDLDENGETSTTFTPDEPGEYAFLLGTIETGDGFTEHDDEDLSFNVFTDTVGIVGLEGMAVQRTSSDVTAPSETKAGDEIEFTADSNLAADKVTHAILSYDKEAFEGDSVTIDETDVEELSDDVFRLTSSGERAGEAFFLETTVDTADLDDGEFKLTIHGTVADSDGTFEAIIDEDGEVEVLEDSFEGDELDISVHDDGVVTGQLDGIHFSLGVVADGDSVETISMPLGEHADIDEDDTETYQWIHAAVDQDDTDERSSSANTIDVSGTVDPAVNVVDATLNRTSIETGEAVELTLEVDNPGDAEATDDVVITVDDNEVTTWPVTLGAGETDTETFTLRFSVEGEYEVAANDVIAGTVIVSESDTDPDPDPDPDPRPWPTPSPTVSVTERVGGASITVTNLPQGQTIQIDAGTSISAGGTTVTGYAANTTRDMDSLDIEIDSNETVPEGTPELNLGTAFSYINVDTGGLTDDDFENVQWQFTVEQAKLDERDRTPEDVRLFRYSVADNEWQELPTEHVGGEEYTADAPGFSVFAVGTVGQSDIEVVDAELAEETVEVDETFTTTATVENSGDADGEYTAELEVDGQVVDSQEVTVAAGESETVEFTHTIDDVGSYEISVNGVVAGTLEVEAAPTPTPTPDTPTPDTPTETPETPDPDPAAPSVLFAGFIAMILFVAGGLGIYYYREDRFPWEADTAAAGADPFSAFDDEGAGDDTGSGNGDGSTNTRTDDAPDPLADEGDASDGSEEDQRT